jgi:hypothetical protein
MLLPFVGQKFALINSAEETNHHHHKILKKNTRHALSDVQTRSVGLRIYL